MFSLGMVVPALIIALLAWFVPQLWSRVLPEGVRPLLLNALLSTFVLFAISAVFFVVLYWIQGVKTGDLAEFGFVANLAFFGRLGLIAGLIWGPIMVLSVANLPRAWVEKVW